jgi:hypothetical protein
MNKKKSEVYKSQEPNAVRFFKRSDNHRQCSIPHKLFSRISGRDLCISLNIYKLENKNAKDILNMLCGKAHTFHIYTITGFNINLTNDDDLSLSLQSFEYSFPKKGLFTEDCPGYLRATSIIIPMRVQEIDESTDIEYEQDSDQEDDKNNGQVSNVIAYFTKLEEIKNETSELFGENKQSEFYDLAKTLISTCEKMAKIKESIMEK